MRGVRLDKLPFSLIIHATLKTARRGGWRQILAVPFTQTSPKLLKAENTSLFPLFSPRHLLSFRPPPPEFLSRDADPAPHPLLVSGRRGGGSNREARPGSGKPPAAGHGAPGSAVRRVRGCAGHCRLRDPPPMRPSPELAPRPRGSAPPALPRHPGPRSRARASVREVRGGGTYQLLPDPAPHAPSVAVPVPRAAGAEGLQAEADEPEGKAGEPLRLKFRSPRPPHSPRRGPISRAGSEVLLARSRRRPHPTQLSLLPRRSHLHY